MTRDFEWLRSPFCSNGACVEVARAGRRVVLVQDSKAPASGGGVLQAWAPPEWCGLIGAIKVYADHVAVEYLPSGHVRLGFRHADRHELLTFTAAEWHAFCLGVRAGTFDLDKLSKLSSPAPVEGFGSAGRSAGLDGTGEPSEAATGAGMAGSPPAPVAAESWVSGPNGSPMNVPAGRPSPVHPTQVSPPQEAVRPGPGPFVPADLFAPTVEEVEELAAVLAEASRSYALLADGGEPSALVVARYLLAAGYVRAAVMPPPEVTEHWCQVVTGPAWGSGPLVEHISDTGSSRGRRAVDAGSVPAQSGVGDVEGSAGPGLPPRGSGPADSTGGAS